ncbi:hypothetical protein ACTWP5_19120 [Streptomyces sp. 4N509B]|uniref:hypothetical protein n=1 Tax=Streptomyces sp. 4N509B TaxID=3457413 RepID=UPI003FD44518
MSERPSTRRRRRWPLGASAALLVAASAAYAVSRLDLSEPAEPHCAVSLPDGETGMTLELEQAANAATIGAVGSTRGLSERAVTIAIATAIQESRLRNIDYGDRDSLGLFQQRPSQGWGTPEEILDPVYAAEQFYDHLVEVPDYETLPLTEAAQAVQRSGFPDAYAQHEEEAALLAAALTGRRAAALNCVVGDEPVPGRPEETAERVDRQFGGQVPVTVEEGPEGGLLLTPEASPDASGEAAASADGPDRGWELAHWAVAHAAELGIRRIDYGERIWEADRSSDGWREPTEEELTAGGAVGGLRLGMFPAG